VLATNGCASPFSWITAVCHHRAATTLRNVPCCSLSSTQQHSHFSLSTTFTLINIVHIPHSSYPHSSYPHCCCRPLGPCTRPLTRTDRGPPCSNTHTHCYGEGITGFAPCDNEAGTCSDLWTNFTLPGSDPRVVLHNSTYYNFHEEFGGVALSTSATPLDNTSWKP
jgi:hypothetical protein